MCWFFTPCTRFLKFSEIRMMDEDNTSIKKMLRVNYSTSLQHIPILLVKKMNYKELDQIRKALSTYNIFPTYFKYVDLTVIVIYSCGAIALA